MSKVFLAEHEMMHRRCAIKMLPSKYQEDPDLLSRFHLEAVAIAELDHPHIVRAYDFNKDIRYGKEIHYLVMEYVEGQDLRRMVEEQGPLDYRKAADFICQAAEGLAHAHKAGFVHRDIKPANLLVDRNGVLKILDLGLARFTFEGEQTWQTPEGEQSAVGTADYVAPEQVMDSRNVDGRADIYSLGLTFYFLLTGRRPFPKATLVELLMAHGWKSPSRSASSVPTSRSELVDDHRADDRQVAHSAIPDRQGSGRGDSDLAARVGQRAGVFADFGVDGRRHAGQASRPPKTKGRLKAEEELILVDDYWLLLEIGDAILDGDTAKLGDLGKSDTAIKRGAPDKSQVAGRSEGAGQVGTERQRNPTEAESGRKRQDVRVASRKDRFVAGTAPQPRGSLADRSLANHAVAEASRRKARYGHRLGFGLHWRRWFASGCCCLRFSPFRRRRRSRVCLPSKSSRRSPRSRQWFLRLRRMQAKRKNPRSRRRSQSRNRSRRSRGRPSRNRRKEQPKTEPKPPVAPVTPPKEPEQPPVKKPDPDKLLAGLTAFSFDFRSSDPNLKSPFNLTIAHQALEAVTQAGLKPAEKNPNVMHIQVKAVDERNNRSVMLTVQMDCNTP